MVALHDDRVLLIEQPGTTLLALPGGKIEPGETASEAGARELAEETGILVGAGDLVDLELTIEIDDRLTLSAFAVIDPPPPHHAAELRSHWVSFDDLDAHALAPAVARSVHAALARLGNPEGAHDASRRLLEWWQRERNDRPWRATRDPYAVLVCEVMSQQTQLVRVVEYWHAWLARWPTVESLARAPLAEVLALWQGLGYPRRARDLHAAARQIVAQGWPDAEHLTQLPGVGRYTADAIRCFALEQPVLPLDANVRRVLARRFPSGLDPGADAWALGQATMELGQRFCRSRPLCAGCPLNAGCFVACERGQWDPAPRPRRAAPYRGSLRERRGQLLRAALAGARPRVSGDPAAAQSLLDDRLVSLRGGRLEPPLP